jgi:hypothetical protein
MLYLIADGQMPIFASHVSLFVFAAVALVLLGLAGFDLRRAAKAASKKSSSMQFLSRYPDENGMRIFFDLGEDCPERSAHRIRMQKRRNSSAR